MEAKRQSIVKEYIKYRLVGDTDSIIKLLSSTCILVDSDTKKTEYTGEESLRKFFASRPPPSISPLIGEPIINKDGNITIVLNAFVKTLTVTFGFENESEVINKITLVEGGLLSGWI